MLPYLQGTIRHRVQDTQCRRCRCRQLESCRLPIVHISYGTHQSRTRTRIPLTVMSTIPHHGICSPCPPSLPINHSPWQLSPNRPPTQMGPRTMLLLKMSGGYCLGIIQDSHLLPHTRLHRPCQFRTLSNRTPRRIYHYFPSFHHQSMEQLIIDMWNTCIITSMSSSLYNTDSDLDN